MATQLKMPDFKRSLSLESDFEMSGDECSESFHDLIYTAEKENRVIKGISMCAHVLETCPEIVQICIIPSGYIHSLSKDIQHKLIRAYCWENDIKVVEVVQNEFNLLTRSQQRNKTSEANSVDCILVTSKTFEEESVEHEQEEDEYLESFG